MGSGRIAMELVPAVVTDAAVENGGLGGLVGSEGDVARGMQEREI